MFILKEFIMKILKEKIGNEPDYRVRELALGWYSKGELTQADLADVDLMIEESHQSVSKEEHIEKIQEENAEISDEPLILE